MRPTTLAGEKGKSIPMAFLSSQKNRMIDSSQVSAKEVGSPDVDSTDVGGQLMQR